MRASQISPLRAANGPPPARPGLSLLEVILALAILGGALAVLGELVRVSTRNAAAARDLTTAQLLCESKLAEITSGIMPLEPLLLVPYEENNWDYQWLYSVDIVPVDLQGLLAVEVTVEQNPEVVSRPVQFSLVRWMLAPEMELDAVWSGGSDGF